MYQSLAKVVRRLPNVTSVNARQLLKALPSTVSTASGNVSVSNETQAPKHSWGIVVTGEPSAKVKVRSESMP